MYLLISLFLNLFSSTILAQNPTDQYVNDHYYQLSIYQKDYSDYKKKHQVHQQFSAISTKDDLISSTKKVFLSRNLTLRTYLTLLRINLNIHLDSHPQTTSDLQSKLQTHEEWLNQQKQPINTATTLKNLQDIGAKFNLVYPQIEQNIQNSIIQAKINRQSKLYQLLIQLNDDIKKIPIQKVDQWFVNIDSQLEQIPNHLQKAPTISYPKAQKELQSSQSLLQQIYSDLKTIIIKTYPQ